MIPLQAIYLKFKFVLWSINPETNGLFALQTSPNINRTFHLVQGSPFFFSFSTMDVFEKLWVQSQVIVAESLWLNWLDFVRNVKAN